MIKSSAPKKTWSLFVRGLVVLGVTLPASSCGAPDDDGSEAFDLYLVGVPIARLVVESSRRFLVEVRDPRAGSWSSPRQATAEQIASDDAFDALRNMRTVPGILDELARLDWEGADEISWPGSETRLVRHRELSARVGRRDAHAVYWAERDGTRPTDLIVGTEGRLLAAVSPSQDMVLVRRGYENFTTVGRWTASDISRMSSY